MSSPLFRFSALLPSSPLSDMINAAGTVPDSAVFRKGVNPFGVLEASIFQKGYIDGITILNLDGEILFSAKFNKSCPIWMNRSS